MRCESARESAYLGRSSFVKVRALVHLWICSHCRRWRADQQRTKALLCSLTPHPIPTHVWRALEETVSVGPVVTEPTQASFTVLSNVTQVRRSHIRKATAIALGVLVVLLAWLGVRPASPKLAWAQMKDALNAVQVVHITGFVTSSSDESATTERVRKDKWLRRDPLALREYQEYTTDSARRDRSILIVGDTEKTYWYFPDRNLVSITKPMPIDVIEDLTTMQGWSRFQTAKGHAPVEHQGQLAGRAVLIVSLPSDPALFGEGGQLQLFIDPTSLLVVRAEAFGQDKGQHQVQLMQLDFNYNADAPARTFEFAIPKGTRILDKRKSG